MWSGTRNGSVPAPQAGTSELTEFFKKQSGRAMLRPPSPVMRVPRQECKYWAIPLEGDATGFSIARTGSRTRRRRPPSRPSTAIARRAKTWKELGDIAEFFHRPKEKRYGISIYTDNSYDALVMGIENVMFSYGGDLGDYATHKVSGIVNSKENIEALKFYKRLYGFTPPDWGKTFFQEGNQGITEGLVSMSMNFFAFFPALANPTTNKYAKVTGYFASPKGPSGKQFGRSAEGVRSCRTRRTRNSR